MKQFNEVTFKQEWDDFYKVLVEINIHEYFMGNLSFCNSSLEDAFKKSPAAINEDSGLSYPGGLLSHIRLSTVIAERLAKMVSNTFNINIKSLKKVCSLMHLSKIEMFMENDNAWEIEKRGLNYKFSKLDGVLKSGDRSILICNNMGIQFTPIEFEAMKALDKEGNDFDNSKYFMNIMTIIIRQANDIAYLIAKEKYNKNN